MPGWTALIDGFPALILRGNHAQRVIPLARPGRHEVILHYTAPGLARGLTLTVLAALGWLAACLVAYGERHVSW
jgi:hypothetical protein